MRWWLRSLAAGAGAGLIVGIVIGGTLGRVFMRLVFLARRDTLGVETAMGAVIGEFHPEDHLAANEPAASPL